MAVPGIPVAIITAGGILAWAGIYNQTLAESLGSILHGKAPSPGPQYQTAVNISVTGDTSSSAGVAATNSAVANDALKYAGSKYVWGGAPGTAKGTDNGTDCSGFVNMVLGRDLGMAVPGYAAGAYTGASHGAPTTAYLIWSGVTSISQSQLQPGDLLVWQTHMGIYVGNGQMISALDPALGVKVTSIQGGSPTGEVLFCKRLTGTSGAITAPSGQNINNPNPVITQLG